MIIIGGEDDSHPTKVNLYKNSPGLTFDDALRKKPDQVLELTYWLVIKVSSSSISIDTLDSRLFFPKINFDNHSPRPPRRNPIQHENNKVQLCPPPIPILPRISRRRPDKTLLHWPPWRMGKTKTRTNRHNKLRARCKSSRPQT